MAVSAHLSEISSSENGAIYKDADDGRMTPSWNKKKNCRAHRNIEFKEQVSYIGVVYTCIKHISYISYRDKTNMHTNYAKHSY